MKKYIVLEAENAVLLEKYVEDLLDRGWTCVGGVSVSTMSTYKNVVGEWVFHSWYAQAMMRETDEN